jgi:sugar phosphate isomerase/epimerase
MGSRGKKDESEHYAKAREMGLFIDHIHAPFDNVDTIWLEGLAGEDCTQRLLACIEDCKTLEIPTMVMHINNEYDYPPVSDIGIQRLMQVVESAERANINVAVENTYAIDHIAYVFAHISSERLGFCFDSGHQNCITPRRDLLAEFGNRLMALHLNDNYGPHYVNPEEPVYEKGTKEWGIQLDRHLLPYEGTVNWGKLARKLKKTPYKGAVVLEGNPYGERSLDEFYEDAFAKASKFWQSVYG